MVEISQSRNPPLFLPPLPPGEMRPPPPGEVPAFVDLETAHDEALTGAAEAMGLDSIG